MPDKPLRAVFASRYSILFCLLLFLTVMVSCSRTQEENAVMYRGDAGRSGVYATQIGEEPGVLWWKKAGSYLSSTPAVVNNTVYFGDQAGNFYALNGETGTEKWLYRAESGITTSPAATSTGVYFSDRSGLLYALDSKNGKEMWRTRIGDTELSPPAYAYGLVYVSHSGVVYALDAGKGNEVWRYHTGGDISGIPAVGNNVLCIMGGLETLFVIDAKSGKLLWTERTDTGFGFVTVFGGNIYVSGHNGIMSWDISGSGKTRLEVVADLPPVINGDRVYVNNGETVSAWAFDGRELWSVKTGGYWEEGPLLVGGTLLAGGRDRYWDRYYAIDAQTGDIQWNFYTSWPTIMSPAAGDGNIYLTAGDIIYAISGNPGVTLDTSLISAGSGLTPQDPRVHLLVPDSRLESAIRGQLGKTGGELTAADLAQLQELDVQGLGIISLDGMEHAVNLRSLNLLYNSLGDISPLSALTKLEKLHLGGLHLDIPSDLSPLMPLIQLQSLYIDAEIGSLEPLRPLQALKTLHVQTYGEDLTPLAELKGLEHLSITFRGHDLSPLTKLNRLDTLHVGGYNVRQQDFAALAGLSRLSSLSLVTANMPKKDVLAKLQNLKRFSAVSLEEGDISGLASLAGLEELVLLQMFISDASSLSALKNLKKLELGGVAGLESIRTLEQLEVLTLHDWHGQLESLSGLENLINLRELYISAPMVTDISPLRALRQLEILYLGYDGYERSPTYVVDIGPLAGLSKLRELQIHFADDQVTDLSAISGLQNLEKVNLSLEYTGVTRLPSLQELHGVKELRLTVHRHFADLSEIGALASLDTLYVYGYTNSEDEPPAGLDKIKSLTGLRKLTLSSLGVSDISGLAMLTGLETLQLDSNRISDISALSGLNRLVTLVLSSNRITDLSPLSGLPRLSYLNFSHNLVTDYQTLNSLPNLQSLSVGGNPLPDLELLRSLSARGVSTDIIR
jgi:outer membrane protein assembly factor BamB/Leucine-rich repeat (LRR) protein